MALSHIEDSMRVFWPYSEPYRTHQTEHMAVEFRQKPEHDKGQAIHGEQGHNASRVGVRELKHLETEHLHFTVNRMKPNNPSVSEDVQDVDEGEGEQQRTQPPLP